MTVMEHERRHRGNMCPSLLLAHRGFTLIRDPEPRRTSRACLVPLAV
jgi:hypothetical protein